MKQQYDTVIHWFRRDLRLTDNTALHAAVESAQHVVPVFIISSWKGEHRWTGAPRQQFLCGSLAALEKNIEKVGGRLLFRCGNAEEQLMLLIEQSKAQAVFTNRDPDPYGIAMENRLAKRCQDIEVSFNSYKDCVLHERAEVLTGSGGPYRVFTPYSRNWHSLPKPAVLPAIKRLRTPDGLKSVASPTLETWDLTANGTKISIPGERAARERMMLAIQNVLPHYSQTRDTPNGTTTSRLSQDLRHGTISIRELYSRIIAAQSEQTDPVAQKSLHTYLNELAWREFYMQILWHFPEVCEHEFNPQWRGMHWDWDEKKLQTWKHGLTGFPIVDAGMRELRETGFMHNRVRMIVAMFLTKDLHLDWRLGEEYFMQMLTDGEIASNNGGWQWSAGTGADAAPYFRIQNPWSQTKRFDPEGAYIRKWVPELQNISQDNFFEPPPTDGLLRPSKDYPLPMVDHAHERNICLTRFKKHRDQMDR